MGLGIIHHQPVEVLLVRLLHFCRITESCVQHFVTQVFVSFNPTTYTVREGVDEYAELMLVRSGDLTRNTTVTVTTFDVSAKGIL